jgi:hypothetical protein
MPQACPAIASPNQSIIDRLGSLGTSAAVRARLTNAASGMFRYPARVGEPRGYDVFRVRKPPNAAADLRQFDAEPVS